MSKKKYNYNQVVFVVPDDLNVMIEEEMKKVYLKRAAFIRMAVREYIKLVRKGNVTK